jgi:NTE family protein
MSMSLPFFYEPVLLKDMSSTGGGPALVVDGGLLSNFPVWLFDTSGIPEWPTFGFGLTKGEGAKPHTVRGPLSMLWALFATMLEAHDERAMEDQDYVRTIQVPTLGVDTVDFNISAEQAQALFDAGYRTAQAFFDGWDFDTYVRLYRKDTSLHGRQLSL